MLRIENVRKTILDGTATPTCILDIQVSTESDLPDLGDTIVGCKIGAGSIAQIIQTGAFATLDDDGSWYDNSGNEI